MKKEKTIKTYQRRTKSGKVVTVKQHTAKYDAADKAKEMASKKGAGEELAAKKGMPDHNLPMNEYLAELKKMRENPEETPMEQETKKSSPSAEKKSKSVKSTKTTKSAATTQANGVSASDFKSWYHFNDWDKPKKSWPAEVRAADAAIRKQLGSKKAYDDYCSQIDSSYSKSGHNKAFKSFGGGAAKSDRKQGDIIPFSKGDKELKKSGTYYVDKDGMRYVKVTGKGYRYTGVAASKGSDKDDTMGKSPAKMTKGDRAVAKMHKLVNEAFSSTTSDPKVLKKQLGALIDYNGGPVNYGDKIGKRIDEIREQLGKRSSLKKRVEKKSDYDYERSMAALAKFEKEERKIAQSKITSKVGKGYKTMKDPTERISAPIYVSSDGKTAYYEDHTNKGKLKKASDALLKRLTKDKESATKSKESKPNGKSAPFSKPPVDTGSTKGNLKRAVAEGKITQAKADAIMGKKTNEAKTAKTGAVTWTTWKTQMQNKYQGQGKNAEILSLLGVAHSMRLAPSGFTKGALTTAIKELRKRNSPTNDMNRKIKKLEKLLEQKNKGSKKGG